MLSLWGSVNPSDFKYLDEKNAEEAFKCAHTIKGLCGNLGFDNLLEADVPLVEKLRAGVLEGTSELFEELKKKYDRLCESIINKNKGYTKNESSCTVMLYAERNR